MIAEYNVVNAIGKDIALHSYIIIKTLQGENMMKKTGSMSASVSSQISNRPDVRLMALCRHDGDRMSVVGIFPECSAGYAQSTEELFRYAISVGARLTVLYSAQPAAALLEYVRSNAVTDVIISEGCAHRAERLISHMLPDVSVSSEEV